MSNGAIVSVFTGDLLGTINLIRRFSLKVSSSLTGSTKKLLYQLFGSSSTNWSGEND